MNAGNNISIETRVGNIEGIVGNMSIKSETNCPDCGVADGQPHKRDCTPAAMQ
jgi:hypothetical protein